MATVSKLGWRDRLAKLPPDRQEKVKDAIRKVLKGRHRRTTIC